MHIGIELWDWMQFEGELLELFRTSDAILLAYDIISERAGIQVGKCDRMIIFRQVRIKNIIEIKLGIGNFLGAWTSIKSLAQLSELIETYIVERDRLWSFILD